MPSGAERILVDTGPIVSVLNAGDEHRRWALEVFGSLEPPLYTCEAVLSECQFLLEDRGANPLIVLEWVQQGILKLDFSPGTEIGRLLALQRSYRNLPMDFADACLVRMTEIHPRSRILTTNSHFKIFRRNGRQQIPLLAPPGLR